MSRIKRIAVSFLKFVLTLLDNENKNNVANKDGEDIGGGGIKNPIKP